MKFLVVVAPKSIYQLHILLWFWLWSYPFHRTSMFDSILFYLNRNKNQISILCMPFLHLLEFEFALLFYFIIREGNFFLQQGQWLFFTVNTVDDEIFMKFLTTLSPISVTCRSDCCRHWTFTPHLFHFSHLAGGRVTSVH